MNQPIGRIRSFACYALSQLESMKEDLSLSMTIEQLATCRNYYKKAKKDPFIDELRLIDRFVAFETDLQTDFCITGFQTNDRFVAETYRDVLNKRKQLFPHRTTPIALSEIPEIAKVYQEATGRRNKGADWIPFFADCINVQNFDTYHFSHDLPFCFASFPARDGCKGPKCDDLVVRFVKRNGAETDFWALFSRFLNENTADFPLTSVFSCENGLLDALFHAFGGMVIDMTRLSEQTSIKRFEDLLAKTQEEAVIASFSKVQIPAIMAKAEQYGLSAIPFGLVQENGRFTFFVQKEPCFDLSKDLLLGLIPQIEASVSLQDENGTGLYPVQVDVLNGASNRYFTSTLKKQKAASFAFANGTISSAAVCRPKSGFYRNALLGGLISYLNGFLSSGCNKPEFLAISTLIPKSATIFSYNGDVTSSVLALYRLATELSVQVPSARFVSSDSASVPTFAFHSVVHSGNNIASTYQSNGNFLFWLPIELTQEGLPDFNDLRSLLVQLTEEATENSIASAKIVYCQTVTNALREMETETLRCNLTDPFIAADGAVPFGILLEASKPLTIGKQIGAVCERLTASTSPSLAEPLEIKFYEGQKVLFFSNPADLDALLLQNRLQSGFGCVISDSSAFEEGQDLYGAVLSSDLLVFFENSKFKPDVILKNALSVFGLSGKPAVFLGQNVPDGLLPLLPSLSVLPAGISEED